MGFLFNCSISHSAFHLLCKSGCTYAASCRHIIAIGPAPSASPQKVSLGSSNESLLGRRRAEVIDSCSDARCFLSQHGSPHGEGPVPQHSVTLHISSPPQPQPESPLSPLPPLQTSSNKFDLAAGGRRSRERKQILL